jgi:hypothetical protein
LLKVCKQLEDEIIAQDADSLSGANFCGKDLKIRNYISPLKLQKKFLWQNRW